MIFFSLVVPVYTHTHTFVSVLYVWICLCVCVIFFGCILFVEFHFILFFISFFLCECVCAFCDFSSSNSGIACSEHTITVIVTIATIEINVYAFFFSCAVLFRLTLQPFAAPHHTQSHTDRKREIGESVNRITVHLRVDLTAPFSSIFASSSSLSIHLSHYRSHYIYLCISARFFYLFIYFFCALIQFFHPHINLCIFCCWSVEFCS